MAGSQCSKSQRDYPARASHSLVGDSDMPCHLAQNERAKRAGGGGAVSFSRDLLRRLAMLMNDQAIDKQC